MKTTLLAIVLAMTTSVASAGFFGGDTTNNYDVDNNVNTNTNNNLNNNLNNNYNSNRANAVSGSYSSSKAVGVGVGISGSNSDSVSNSSSGGNSMNSTLTVNEAEIPEETKVTVRNNPSMSAASLTTSNGTCMGSTSVAGSGAAIGFSVGTTWTDEGCTHRYNAQMMHNLGYPKAAINIMCMEADVAQAAPELCGVKEDVVQPRATTPSKAVNGFF